MGPGEWESSANLYQAYRDWAGKDGELPILVVKALAGRLKKKGMEPAKRGGKRGWSGLSLGRRGPRGQCPILPHFRPAVLPARGRVLGRLDTFGRRFTRKS